MKKLFLSLSLVAGFSCAAQAQKLTFGVKAGASLTNVSENSSFASSYYKLGFNGGLMADVRLKDNLFIHPELLYSTKGWRYNNIQDDLFQKLHYLDLPVLARYKAKKLFFEAGPQLGILLAANGLNHYNDAIDPLYLGEDRAVFNKVDFGYVIGLGYQLPTGPGIGLRYNGGITGLYKDDFYTSSGNSRNSAFQLYLSYTFGTK